MGTTKAALALCLCVLGYPNVASGDPCTGQTSSGSPFVTCFDVGNRVYLEGGSDGLGVGIRFRHTLGFDEEPDLTWKIEHRLMEASVGGLHDDYAGVVYAGRYLRHARDGHVVLPLGTPRKFFVPFDIGAETQVGSVRQRDSMSAVEVGVVRFAGLIDLGRSADFHRRFAIGVVAHWDLQFDRKQLNLRENRVAPFSMLSSSTYLESRDGLSTAELDLSAGREWSSRSGWHWQALAALSLERIVIAINDRPLSALFELRASSSQETADAQLTALFGARFSIFAATGGQAHKGKDR